MVYPHIAYCGPAYPDHPESSIRESSTQETAREVDSRTSDGMHVRLLWHPTDGHLSVAVHDTRTGDAFEVPVGAGDRARDVYHHPYAYAASTQIAA
jgi:hypothetical protein